MRFLFLEPFYGGSHRDFADGLAAHSRHRIDLVTLPCRFWKWRMRGAVFSFLRKVEHPEHYDGVLTSDMTNVADLKALWAEKCPPVLVYFHENQVIYPLTPGERPDYQFALTNITTCLSADRTLFNSQFHRSHFLDALRPLLRKMPDFRPNWVVDLIRQKSDVLHPGCSFPGGSLELEPHTDDEPPLVIWNHRWEHDKMPEVFFDALEKVSAAGIPFRIALLGERFNRCPDVFETAQKKFKDRIVHAGYVESKADYQEWLKRGTVVISTAIQENFGISVIEAVRFGCLPLVPHRLAYPEVIPSEFHTACLYENQEELVTKLSDFLQHPSQHEQLRNRLSQSMAKHAWEAVIETYDTYIEQMADEALKRRRSIEKTALATEDTEVSEGIT